MKRTSFMIVIILAIVIHCAVLATRLIASYRALELDGSPLSLGLVASSFAILSMISAIPFGRLVDRHSEPPFIVAGALAVGLGSVLTVTVDSIPLLAISQAVAGLGQLSILIGAQTLVGTRGDPRTRTNQFGLYAAGVSSGQLLGPIVGALIISSASRGDDLIGPLVFAGLSLATLLLGVVLMRLEWAGRISDILSTRVAISSDTTRSKPSPRIPMSQILRWPGMRLAMISSLAINLGSNSLVVFLPAYGDANGLPVELVGALLTIRGGAAILSRVMTGPVVKWFGADRTLLGCVLGAGLALAAVSLTTDPIVLTILMCIVGACLGLGQPITLTWVSTAAPPGTQGTAMALRVSGNRGGQLVAPLLLGALAGPLGVGAVFTVLAGGLIGAGALLMREPLPHDAA